MILVCCEYFGVIVKIIRKTFNAAHPGSFYLSLWLLISVVAVFSGPFGTYKDLALQPRGLFWVVVVGLAILIFIVANKGVRALWRNHSSLSHAAAATAVSTVLFAPVAVLSPHLIHWQMNRAPYWLDLVLLFALLSLGIHWSRYLLHPGTAAAPVPRLLNRLPATLRGSLLRLTVRDHYVDVHTDKGMHSLLMRFRDATQEADGVEGFCTHRSHWVAQAAVTGVRRENGRIFLTLKDGTDIPVSRKYKKNVVDAGFL